MIMGLAGEVACKLYLLVRLTTSQDTMKNSSGTHIWVRLTSFQSFDLRTNFSKVLFYEEARNFLRSASSCRRKTVQIQFSSFSIGRDSAGPRSWEVNHVCF